MLYRWDVTLKNLLLNFLICIIAPLQASSISLTDDRPPDNQKVELGKDVSLTWSFSYANSEVISQGPWNARGVQEIIFGTWKPIADGIYLDEKIAAVYSNGTFKARDGYGRDELDWNWSKYKLTFTIKSFTLQDQAKYGINVEFSSAQKSLKDTVDVKTGASYTGQDANSTVRNETAFTSETVDLLFKRSDYDQEDDFSKYRIYKGNVTTIILKKEQDGNDHGFCSTDSVLFNQCQKRYSLRYVNGTHVSFRLRNVTLQDSGRYVLQAYFGGVSHDPEYAEINFSVQEKPSTHAPVEPSSTQAYETSAPKAKSGHSDIKFSVTLVFVLMTFQVLFNYL
ncbi:uncharacterized protein LOC144654734 isoform X1 [Oculina patagonica]